ncbi:MAG TPA: sulfite exporter TauE/SafE family protein [Polyangiales bacterium]|nr:sulfite exporter TauE/SafE family protein [Polyangiales bacterium]
MLTALLSGAAFGAFNLAHCAGMCGPLAAAGCSRTGRTGLFRYQLGRTLAYVYAGALAGHFGRGLELYGAGWSVWLFALLTAAACVVSASSLWRSSRARGLHPLRVGPRPRSLFGTLLRLMPRDPGVLGLLSLLLPCGLLAAALLAAITSGSAPAGATFMLGFAAVSGVAVLGTGRLVQLTVVFSPRQRRGLAVVLLLAAALSVGRPLAALGNAPTSARTHACH